MIRETTRGHASRSQGVRRHRTMLSRMGATALRSALPLFVARGGTVPDRWWRFSRDASIEGCWNTPSRRHGSIPPPNHSRAELLGRGFVRMERRSDEPGLGSLWWFENFASGVDDAHSLFEKRGIVGSANAAPLAERERIGPLAKTRSRFCADVTLDEHDHGVFVVAFDGQQVGLPRRRISWRVVVVEAIADIVGIVFLVLASVLQGQRASDPLDRPIRSGGSVHARRTSNPLGRCRNDPRRSHILHRSHSLVKRGPRRLRRPARQRAVVGPNSARLAS